MGVELEWRERRGSQCWSLWLSEEETLEPGPSLE